MGVAFEPFEHRVLFEISRFRYHQKIWLLSLPQEGCNRSSRQDTSPTTYFQVVDTAGSDDSFSEEESPKKRHDLLTRRPSYRKILNDLGGGEITGMLSNAWFKLFQIFTVFCLLYWRLCPVAIYVLCTFSYIQRPLAKVFSYLSLWID